MIAADTAAPLDLILPTARVVCELVAADHKRYDLEGILDFNGHNGGVFRVVKSTLPDVGGEYKGDKDNIRAPREADAVFMREKGKGGTGILFKLFSPQRMVATVGVITSDNPDGNDPTLLAGGVCNLEERK